MKHKACEKCVASVGTVNVIGNILMIAVKGYMGVVGRSKGLIADAIHSSADLLATIIMIVGMRISEKEKNERYPHGYGKAEYIVAILIYLFLFIVGGYIVMNGVMSIITGRFAEPCISAAWGAIFSIAINELMFRQSICAGTQISSPSMVAKAWETRSDVYSSIAVLIGIIGAKLGFEFMDPLAAVFVGAIILKICFEMVSESTANLMDRAVDEEFVDKIRSALEAIPDISGVGQLFAREFGRYLEFDVELSVPRDFTVAAGEKIKAEAEAIVRDLAQRKSIVKIRLTPSEAV